NVFYNLLNVKSSKPILGNYKVVVWIKGAKLLFHIKHPRLFRCQVTEVFEHKNKHYRHML
ncbi:hypothetical protein, partial [Butyricimonas virosa]|uniref:hypothetical protein n=1 Tax=Butyricimonas virosa TaxID=544645 RepID=UPI00242C3940